MSDAQPMLLATVVRNLEPYFTSQRLDFYALAAEVGITRASLANPENFVSLSAAARLLDNAAKIIGDPCFGLRCAEAYPMSAVSMLGYIVNNAPTTGDALKAWQRYLRLIVTPVKTTYEVDGDKVYWTHQFPSDFKVSKLQLTLFSTAIIIRRLRQGAGEDWTLEGLELGHEDPGCPEDCARLLAPRIFYNRLQTRMILDVKTLGRNIKGADHKLYGFLKQHAERLLQEQPDPTDIVALTRHRVDCLLEDGNAELAKVAAALNMSARTLRAQLAKAEASFTGLLDEVRAKKAKYYLRETDMQMTEVAFLLGFSELSAFSRAAPKWLGKTPSAYRLAKHGPVSPDGDKSEDES